MQNHDPLAGLSIADVVEALVGKMYEPPLAGLREKVNALPDPLKVLILVSDFDTEVLMNGITGFLENLTGKNLLATIEAFEVIGATSTAATLRDIEATMRHYGVTHKMLRQPMASVEEFSIVSSSTLYDQKIVDMLQAITKRASDLYLYQTPPSEAIFELLCQYLEPRRAELLQAASAA
ncbi:DMP19 family protein [Aquabacterium humicola]|uniref:DMP19 family protein n=1 Tax=Aquabacterium humicola TaxID=3237377 RepID=UPI00254334E8|nr:DUF4375 domain-containing protein [Rubrivivax pictus]